MADGRLLFAEPEVGELLMDVLRQQQGEPVAVHHTGAKDDRRSHLPADEVEDFQRWLKGSDQAGARLVIVGSPNTTSTDGGEGGNPVLRQAQKLLERVPPIQQVVVALSSALSPEYRGSGWLGAQVAQLLQAANITRIELVGQTRHLEDYARRLMEEEYGRAAVTVTSDSSEGPHRQRLLVWDPDSSQGWVQSQAAWKSRLALAKVLIRVDALGRRFSRWRNSGSKAAE